MYYHKVVYISIAQLVYEAIAVASFYLLMRHWMAPDLDSQKEVFHHRRVPKWVLIRFCGVRSPKSGLSWFNVSVEAAPQITQAVY